MISDMMTKIFPISWRMIEKFAMIRKIPLRATGKIDRDNMEQYDQISVMEGRSFTIRNYI